MLKLSPRRPHRSGTRLRFESERVLLVVRFHVPLSLSPHMGGISSADLELAPYRPRPIPVDSLPYRDRLQDSMTQDSLPWSNEIFHGGGGARGEVTAVFTALYVAFHALFLSHSRRCAAARTLLLPLVRGTAVYCVVWAIVCKLRGKRRRPIIVTPWSACVGLRADS